MRTALVALLIILIVLLWFNPDMNDFKTFAQIHSERILLHETGDTALGRALAGAGGALTGAYVDRITERRNYLVFSTYTLDLDGADEEGNEWRFLGIGGGFFEMQQPKALRDREN